MTAENRGQDMTGVQRSEIAAHTPGPWVAEVDVISGGGWVPDSQRVFIQAGKTLIAYYKTDFVEYPSDDENAANARLIAAAPDMLDAHRENARILRFLVNELQGRVEAGKLGAIISCLGRSDAAIAKATGTERGSPDTTSPQALTGVVP